MQSHAIFFNAPISILYAEDTKSHVMTLKQMLKKITANPAPATLTHVENGQLAIEQIKANQYDIIILDDEMPVKNGSEAYPEIVDILTSQNRRNITKIYCASTTATKEKFPGIDGELKKPFNKDNLINVLSPSFNFSQPGKIDTKELSPEELEAIKILEHLKEWPSPKFR